MSADEHKRAIAEAMPGQPIAKFVYAQLAWHYNPLWGYAYPGRATLMAECGIGSERTLERALTWLRDGGWIAVQRGNRYRSSRYTLPRIHPTPVDSTRANVGTSRNGNGHAPESLLPPNRDSIPAIPVGEKRTKRETYREGRIPHPPSIPAAAAAADGLGSGEIGKRLL